MLSDIANHLWQSTAFAAAAALLALSLRSYPAQARHWIWLVASLKFLVPFSLLTRVGSLLPGGTELVLPRAAELVRESGRPYAEPVFMSNLPAAVREPESILPALLLAAWLCGAAAILSMWLVRWRRVRAAVRTAQPCPVDAPIPVLSSASTIEPGVFGIFRPVLLLPQGIAERLSPAQLHAVLAHELSHVRRRDNLAAAIQMAVEAVFWFHPLVWWIGSRLVNERERACDEEVLRMGSEPEVYAEGILNVCKFYLQSPVPCVSGITGSDLKKRVEAIMTGRISPGLTRGRKLLLACAGTAAVAAPLLIGVFTAPVSIAQNLVFEVASIKPAAPNQQGGGFNIQPGEKLRARNITLHRLIAISYGVRDFQVTGGPEWMTSLTWDILASPDRPRPDRPDGMSKREREIRFGEIRQRVRNLLADRFKLAIHKESKQVPVYVLVPTKSGPKLKTADHENESMGVQRGRLTAHGANIDMLAGTLSESVGRPVTDETGLKGRYDFKLEWTPDQFTGGGDGPVVNPPDGALPSLFTALQEQLGLRLDSRRGPVEIIVVDKAEKPTEN